MYDYRTWWHAWWRTSKGARWEGTRLKTLGRASVTILSLCLSCWDSELWSLSMTFRLLSVCMTRGWRSRLSTELVLDSGILLITQEEIMQRLRMSRMLSHLEFIGFILSFGMNAQHVFRTIVPWEHIKLNRLPTLKNSPLSWQSVATFNHSKYEFIYWPLRLTGSNKFNY